MNASKFADTRPLPSIRKIVLSAGSMEVNVTHGDPSLRLTSQLQSALAEVTTEVRGDELIVSRKQSVNGNSLFQNRGGTIVINGSVVIGGSISASEAPIIVDISLPNLRELDLRGAGTVNLLNINQKSLEVTLSGAGNIHAHGSIDELKATISGAGKIRAKSLHTGRASLAISGSGGIDLQVSKEIHARVSGVGNINIVGSPLVRDVRVSGIGKVDFQSAPEDSSTHGDDEFDCPRG